MTLGQFANKFSGILPVIFLHSRNMLSNDFTDRKLFSCGLGIEPSNPWLLLKLHDSFSRHPHLISLVIYFFASGTLAVERLLHFPETLITYFPAFL